MEYWLTFDGEKSSAEDKSEKEDQAAILKSFKENLIAEFRHKNASVQVRDKTLSWPEAVRKGYVYAHGAFHTVFTNGGKNFKSKT